MGILKYLILNVEDRATMYTADNATQHLNILTSLLNCDFRKKRRQVKSL